MSLGTNPLRRKQLWREQERRKRGVRHDDAIVARYVSADEASVLQLGPDEELLAGIVQMRVGEVRILPAEGVRERARARGRRNLDAWVKIV